MAISNRETDTNVRAWSNKNGEGEASALPEVTAEDNGKVLAVVNGEWSKAEEPEGLKVVSVDPLSETASTAYNILCYYDGDWQALSSLFLVTPYPESIFKINAIPNGFFVAYIEEASSYIIPCLGINIIDYEANDNLPSGYGHDIYCLTGNGEAIVFEDATGNCYAFITNDAGEIVPAGN